MAWTYLRIELKRVLRDPVMLFFVAVLPIFFYVAFALAVTLPAGRIGIAYPDMYVMIGMAAYGAATAAANISGQAAVERLQGWGRQLGLTPLSDAGYVGVKAAVSMIIALLPIVGTYSVGFFAGVRAPVALWLGSAAVLLVGSASWALYGLCAGLAFRSEAALAAATGGLVIFAFVGNLFFPLTGGLLALARWTPLYGYVSLARFPITGGNPLLADGSQPFEALWVPVANVTVWTAAFALLARSLVRRGRSRG